MLFSEKRKVLLQPVNILFCSSFSTLANSLKFVSNFSDVRIAFR